MSESQTMPETSEKGLTAAEVAALTESGQVNAVKSSTSRSFADIVRANVFTLFNGIIFAAMVMVLVTGSWRDAVFGLVILINTGIGIITEPRLKKTWDMLVKNKLIDASKVPFEQTYTLEMVKDAGVMP